MKTQTPSSQATGKGSRLTLWLTKLPKHSMALNADIARKTKQAITDPNATSERLEKIILQDPILCLKLFLKAQRQLKQKDGDIQGMVHLIGLLGLNQIQETLTQAKTETSACEGQKELLSASLFAAHLASQLMPTKHGTRGERFFLPTLFFNAPLWLMWTAAPKLMDHGQVQASQKHRALEPLCQKSLGFSLHALLDQTQVFLPLPKQTLKALAMDFHRDMAFWAKVKRRPNKALKHWFDKDKSAKQLFNATESGIYLINQYVLAIYLDWQGKHIRRWSTLLTKYFNISPEQLDRHAVEVATQLTLPSYLSGKFSPLHRYRGLHREQQGQRAQSGQHNSDRIQHYLGQLKQTYSLHHCLQLTLEALTEGAQVEHCFILTLDAERKLQIPICYGFAEQDLQTLTIDAKHCGQLIRSLLQKPVALAINQAKLKGIEKQWPNTLTQYWQPRPCGIMSLFHKDKPYAIVVCDHHDWNAERHRQFTRIGKQLSQTLKQCHITEATQ